MGAACFFEQPWSRVSTAFTEDNQPWLLNEAAFYLRALGRLTEALEPMRASLGMTVKREDWKNAVIDASNLSQLELNLGEVALAVEDAEQSVTYAERSGDAFQRMGKRTTYADALHQAGRRDEAAALFREAEDMQAGDQPEYPRLYSLRASSIATCSSPRARRLAARFVQHPTTYTLAGLLPQRLRAREADNQN